MQRLDLRKLGEEEPSAPHYSPTSRPFAQRPVARTPQGMSLLFENPLADKLKQGSGDPQVRL